MNENFFNIFADKAVSDDPHEQYVALTIALQLPGICSRVDFPRYPENSGDDDQNPSVLYVGPNGRPLDKRLYTEWLRLHKQQFQSWWLDTMPFGSLCNALYELRDHLTRKGSLEEASDKLVLTERGCPVMYIGGVLYMSIPDFCQDIFTVASESLSADSQHTKSTVQAGTAPDEVAESVYLAVRNEATEAYNAFWRNRDAALKLYQHYCRYGLGHRDYISDFLQRTTEGGLFGLSREDTKYLMVVLAEVEAFDTDLGHQLSMKYFGK